MGPKNENMTEKLLSFLENSPTAFQATDNIVTRLKENGFVPLNGKIKVGGKYYITKNGSAVVAFSVPERAESFMIAASHSDSPMFKLKPNFEDESKAYVRLDVEKYGGMNMATWLDRPLGIAGRIVVQTDGGLQIKNIDLKKDAVLIPSVCVHFCRNVNDGYAYNPAVDMLPLASAGGKKGQILSAVAKQAGCKAEDIVGHDLFVYNRTKASVWGTEKEFFSAPRIDDLMCAFATLEGFLNASPREVAVYAVFDNEETGSETKQGAGSLLLRNVLDGIAEAYGKTTEEMLRSGFMVSADNGHAVHPNHPELSDGLNAPEMNKGVVIKTNANQKYTTDAVSFALFKKICAKAGVPVQVFANRSDVAGGSTLGSIADTTVPVNTVDIGLAQLSMHSAYETAGSNDTAYLVKAAKAFYETSLFCKDDEIEMRK